MARPVKNYCDYFPHDAGMRNHRKVKAIITKFGIVGYGYWSMLLEVLTSTEDFTIKLETDIEWELLSSDLHTTSDTLKEFIQYLITLSLLKTENNNYWSDNLIERFSSLLNKRIRAKKAFEEGKEIERKIGKKIQSTNGINRALRLSVYEKFDFKCANCQNTDPDVLDVHHKTPRHKGGADEIDNLELLCANCHRKEHSLGISVTETVIYNTDIKNNSTDIPQSKVKESKVKESILDNGTWESEKNQFLIAEQWQMKQISEFGLNKEKMTELMNVFLKEIENKEDYKDLKELKKHWYNWYKFQQNGKQKQPELSEYQKKLLNAREEAKKRTA